MSFLRALPLIVVAAIVLAGCGGGGGSKSQGTETQGGGTESTPTVTVTDAFMFSMTNCLIDANWNVTPKSDEIDGVSERGVLYTIKFYPSADAAKAKAGKKGIVLGNAVVLLNVKGQQNAGGVNTPVKPTTERATIQKCVTGAAG